MSIEVTCCGNSLYLWEPDYLPYPENWEQMSRPERQSVLAEAFRKVLAPSTRNRRRFTDAGGHYVVSGRPETANHHGEVAELLDDMVDTGEADTHRRIRLDCPTCKLGPVVVRETKLNELLTQVAKAAPGVSQLKLANVEAILSGN